MLQILPPLPRLLPFVKAYWFLNLAQGSGTPLAMSPAPEQCLYFYPRSQPKPFDANGKPLPSFDNIIMGQSVSGGTTLLVPDGYCMFKILFQPGGLYRLFGTPMTLFANSYEETISVLGQPVEQLREQIANASGFGEIVDFCNQFLLQQLNRTAQNNLPIDRVLHQSHWSQMSLDQLATAACLSTRQFERKFLERVGVSPKLYQRIIRFNHVMKLKNAHPTKKWIDIAYTCGYFDQMHLLRDFKQFTGKTPTNFDFERAVIY